MTTSTNARRPGTLRLSLPLKSRSETGSSSETGRSRTTPSRESAGEPNTASSAERPTSVELLTGTSVPIQPPSHWVKGQLLNLKRYTDGSFRCSLLGEDEPY